MAVATLAKGRQADGIKVEITYAKDTGLATFASELISLSYSMNTNTIDLHHLGTEGMWPYAPMPNYDGGTINLTSHTGTVDMPADLTGYVTVKITFPTAPYGDVSATTAQFSGLITSLSVDASTGNAIQFQLGIKLCADPTQPASS